MQYQQIVNENGERFWVPLLAGAAILSAPFWLNNNKCCNNTYYPQPYPYPYFQPYPYPYGYQYVQPPIIQNITRK